MFLKVTYTEIENKTLVKGVGGGDVKMQVRAHKVTNM